jgi:hypothetical protein
VLLQRQRGQLLQHRRIGALQRAAHRHRQLHGRGLPAFVQQRIEIVQAADTQIESQRQGDQQRGNQGGAED